MQKLLIRWTGSAQRSFRIGYAMQKLLIRL